MEYLITLFLSLFDDEPVKEEQSTSSAFYHS